MSRTQGQRRSADSESGVIPRQCGAIRARSFLDRAPCWLALAHVMLIGCGEPKVPAPHAAIDRYIAAVERRDVETIWSMMNSGARKNVSKSELAHLLGKNHKELIKKANGLKSPERRIEQRAVMFLDHGSQMEFVLERGQFHLKYQDLLMGDAASPEQAVQDLRMAVQQRDYRRVLALLSAELKDDLEAGVESLTQTLSDLDAAVLDVQGDSATYTFPGGSVVQLKKVGETWLITELP